MKIDDNIISKDGLLLKSADESAKKAISQNAFFSKYIMAIDHALLWIAALSLAAYFITTLIITMRNRWIIQRHSSTEY